MSTSPAAGLLARQLKQMQTDKDIPGISCGLADNNIFEWEVMLMINDECKFYGGMVAFQSLSTPSADMSSQVAFSELDCRFHPSIHTCPQR